MKLLKNKKYTLHWEDTFSESEWSDIDDIKKLTKDSKLIRTSGYFVGYFGSFVVVAATINTASDGFCPYSDIIWIPKGCIQKISKG